MQVIEHVPYSVKFITVPLKGQRLSVTAQIILARRKAQFSTGLRCEMDEWDFEKDTFKVEAKHLRYLTGRLSEVETRIYDAYIALRNSGSKPTASAIVRVASGKAEVGSPRLLRYIADYIGIMHRKGTYSPKTIGMYDVMMRYMERYLKKKRISDLRLSELKRAHLVGFQDFLLTEYNPQCKGPISRTSSNKYIKKLQVVINDALAREEISRNPMLGFKLEHERVNIDFLTPDEIQRIADHDFDDQPHLDGVRKAFIFACYSGLRYQDLMGLKREQVFEQDGHTWIRVRQMKTKVLLTRPLFRPAVAIYRYYMEKFPNMETVFPYLCNQYVNRELKKIARICGIHDKKLTFHTARHSHACFLIEKGAGLLETSFFMGHTSTRSTEVYAKVTRARAMSVVDAID